MCKTDQLDCDVIHTHTLLNRLTLFLRRWHIMLNALSLLKTKKHWSSPVWFHTQQPLILLPCCINVAVAQEFNSEFLSCAIVWILFYFKFTFKILLGNVVTYWPSTMVNYCSFCSAVLEEMSSNKTAVLCLRQSLSLSDGNMLSRIFLMIFASFWRKRETVVHKNVL